ncbi:MAG: hypothetical protein ACHREM_29360 [Polyangiales bacterium]
MIDATVHAEGTAIDASKTHALGAIARVVEDAFDMTPPAGHPHRAALPSAKQKRACPEGHVGADSLARHACVAPLEPLARTKTSQGASAIVTSTNDTRAL